MKNGLYKVHITLTGDTTFIVHNNGKFYGCIFENMSQEDADLLDHPAVELTLLAEDEEMQVNTGK